MYISCDFAFTGVCLGLIDPMLLSLPGKYFEKKMATAFSIVFLGVDVCLLVVPAIFAISEERYGFRGAMLILAGIWLHGVFAPFVAWPIHGDKDTISHGGQYDTIEYRSSQENVSMRDASMTEKQPLCATDDAELSHVKNEKFAAFCARIIDTYAMLVSNGKLFSVYLIILSGIMGCLNVNFIIPSVAQELGMSHLQTAKAFAIQSVFSLVARLAAGFAIDRWDIPKTEFIMVSYGIMIVMGLTMAMFLVSTYCSVLW